MHKKFIKYLNGALLFVFLCVVSASVFLTSCKDDDNDDNGSIVLQSYGPMPIARGAELRFIGNHLDLVTSVVVPTLSGGDTTISTFSTKTAELITITVPQNAAPGYLVLKTPQGDITPKTAMAFSEPISIASMSPSPIRIGQVITISGDYLNLVGKVIFKDNSAVDSSDFITQSRYELTLKVPDRAQTGQVAVSNGAEDPIVVYSTDTLKVVTPVITSFSPNPVKAGTVLTINGTNLDLVVRAIFGGEKTVDSSGFISQTVSQINVNVPINTQNASSFVLNPASLVDISSGTLNLVIPTITSVSPNPASPGTGSITVIGTDLDLITSVVFGGNVQGSIESGGTSNQISVSVPATAIDGVVTFSTASGTSVSSASLNMVVPSITSITPDDADGALTATTVTIAGTDLDVISKAYFEGDVEGTIIDGQTKTSIQVKIPSGVAEGLRTIRLVATNGTEVQSGNVKVDIKHRNPTITSLPSQAFPDGWYVINGLNLDLIVQAIFPNGKTVSLYGTKTSTTLELYVPIGSKSGHIKLINVDGDVFLTDSITVPGVDPILASTIMISNFDGSGASQSTWGGVVTFGIPSIDLNGTPCMIGKTGSGWNWTWAQNWDNNCRPALAHPENYVLKFDICITKAAPDVSAGICLKGWTTAPSLGNPFAAVTNGNWVTMTFDILTSDMSIDGTGDWGIWINSGSNFDLSGVMIDNLRFDLK